MAINWSEIDDYLHQYELGLVIPDAQLAETNNVLIKSAHDLLDIPREPGCYWIWTNEPVAHSFHPNVEKFPIGFNGGEVIYNGIAKGDIQGRIRKHLLGEVNEGMSAIGLDLLTFHYNGSHRKKAFGLTGKVPYLNGVKIKSIGQLKQIGLSAQERTFVNTCNHPIFFRNGINVLETKHQEYDYRVYYLSGFNSYSYGDIIEKRWREQYGMPKLCSYSKGR